ncbi:MAG TPA: CbtB-domain containing protein [Rhodospirillales bacterium]|nr:CbtB-domain containing protein [Rhodospirillales bacterium]
MTYEKTLSPQHEAARAATKKLPAILALGFGLFIILGAGFSQISAVHNAAHDVRHSFAFPCH